MSERSGGGAQVPATDEHLTEVFEYWYRNNRNMSQTSKHFDHNRKTIWRWAVRDDWTARADRIAADIAKGVDRRITKDVISNVKLAQSCLNKELAVYLDPKKKASGSLQYIIPLLKYIDAVNQPNELADAIRAAAKLDDIPFDPEMAEEVKDFLEEALKEAEAKLSR